MNIQLIPYIGTAYHVFSNSRIVRVGGEKAIEATEKGLNLLGRDLAVSIGLIAGLAALLN